VASPLCYWIINLNTEPRRALARRSGQFDKMQVMLTVTTDASGVAREAVVAPQDAGPGRRRHAAAGVLRAGNPGGAGPALRQPALPQSMLGKTNG